MSNESARVNTFVIENCIISYPHIFQPQQVNGKGDPKYSAALLVTPEVANTVYAKAQELAAGHFKNNEAGLPNFAWPVTPCTHKQQYMNDPALAQLYVINAKASADYPPQVIDEARQPVLDRGKIYAGCKVAAGITLYTYNNMGNVGVGVGLSAIMKTGEGTPLAGDTVDAASLFGNVQADQPAAPQGMPMPGGMAQIPQGMPPQQQPPVQGMPAPQMPGAPFPDQGQAPAAVPGVPGLPNLPGQ